MNQHPWKCLLVAVFILPLAAATFTFFCRPVVVLHYSKQANTRIGYFFNDNHDITKSGLAPGEVAKLSTALFPDTDIWISLTFPRERGDTLEITEPFSRVDVYIAQGGQIERTVVRHGFFSRFKAPHFP